VRTGPRMASRGREEKVAEEVEVEPDAAQGHESSVPTNSALALSSLNAGKDPSTRSIFHPSTPPRVPLPRFKTSILGCAAKKVAAASDPEAERRERLERVSEVRSGKRV
jgi:hypothetical protein